MATTDPVTVLLVFINGSDVKDLEIGSGRQITFYFNILISCTICLVPVGSAGFCGHVYFLSFLCRANQCSTWEKPFLLSLGDLEPNKGKLVFQFPRQHLEVT